MDAELTLVSVGTDAAAQAMARRVLGRDGRLSLVLADGLEFLRAQEAGLFDLVFADAMPGKDEVWNEALAVMRMGGFYVVDDMLPQANWPEGHAAKVPVLMRKLAGRGEFAIVPML